MNLLAQSSDGGREALQRGINIIIFFYFFYLLITYQTLFCDMIKTL